jgi:hypothetical protein
MKGRLRLSPTKDGTDPVVVSDDSEPAAVSVPSSPILGRENRLSRSALSTTVTLEAAIAPAAHIGVNAPNTASGIMTTL